MLKILIFGDVTRPPFINNLIGPVRAFERVARVDIVEPRLLPEFASTGVIRRWPVEIPESVVRRLVQDYAPDVVACLGGGLFLASATRALFAEGTVFAGFVLSDPLGIDASLAVASEFDLFYTQDPQTVEVYRASGINIGRFDPATDAELFHPMDIEKDCDIIFFGKWTPLRDLVVTRLAERFAVRVHAYPRETRWSIPALPTLNEPLSVCTALNAARLSLEVATMDDIDPALGTWGPRMTMRTMFAASCGVPSLIEYFDGLRMFLEPSEEILAYRSLDEMIDLAGAAISDEAGLRAMGDRARRRALSQHTWDIRVRGFLQDLASVRSPDVVRAK